MGPGRRRVGRSESSPLHGASTATKSTPRSSVAGCPQDAMAGCSKRTCSTRSQARESIRCSHRAPVRFVAWTPPLTPRLLPRPRDLTADETRIIAELSRLKQFDFNASRGIVRLANPSLPLDSTVESEPARQQDAHARFLLYANPAAHEGDRLATLTEVSLGNLTPLGARMVSSSSDLARQPATQPGRE